MKATGAAFVAAQGQQVNVGKLCGHHFSGAVTAGVVGYDDGISGARLGLQGHQALAQQDFAIISDDNGTHAPAAVVQVDVTHARFPNRPSTPSRIPFKRILARSLRSGS